MHNHVKNSYQNALAAAGDIAAPTMTTKEEENLNNISSVKDHPIHLTTKFLGEQGIAASLQYLVNANQCDTIVLGISEVNIFRKAITHDIASMYYWVLYAYTGDVVLTKGMAYVRPFNEHVSCRNFCCYLPDTTGYDTTNDNNMIEDHINYLKKVLQYIRPTDSLTLVRFFPSSLPMGDNRSSVNNPLRYDFGHRQGWLKSSPQTVEPNRIGWNEETIEQYRMVMSNLLNTAQVKHQLRLECDPNQLFDERTTAQRLYQIAFEEECDAIMLPWKQFQKEDNQGGNNVNESPFALEQTELVIEMVQDVPYTLFLIKQ